MNLLNLNLRVTPLVATASTVLLLACGSPTETPEPTLKSTFAEDFLIGAAINLRQVEKRDSIAEPIIARHFNTLTAENLMKWVNIHPEEDVFNWGPADAFVELGEELDAFMVGHTLVWHQQIPKTVFEDAEGRFISKDRLLARMQRHIEEVVGRYKGRVHAWDVLNEALNDDGTFRTSNWYTVTGTDYISMAFKTAARVDPNAELYYNDYNLWKPEKRDAAIKLCQELQKSGIRVDGIGMQGHYSMVSPDPEQIRASILAIHEAGFKVMVTELDIEVLPRPQEKPGADIDVRFDEDMKYNPYPDGLPEEVYLRLADRYEEIFRVFYEERDKIHRITFWGVTDANSWLNNWPIRRRTNYPLLFDRQGNPKTEILERIYALKQQP
ncbi:MAG: endo-1,4-beta-xylanase [Lunatimonas sp.]|uniref:endo-1,4-beta-xylanase n=1 Tax=Lunatimonas sp. TaxID=2060141 RepID=UPI00263A4B55|nr:endo-1,4-beta-xylanase [Lunatimonas sp.]MCC5936842.1 endo-1,4-beta-xylanase [Lunatimonas sp.]